MNTEYFSTGYEQARCRFLTAARAAGARIECFPIDSTHENSLSLDVAVIGGESNRALIVTSGVHGVEGFFGSAVQLAILDKQAGMANDADIKVVLIHAVNPYGFARLRRFNEDNVDLNRNFMLNSENYSGAPDGYHQLNRFLNPSSPPGFELFRLKALWNIWRYGMGALKESVAAGQYEYPEGIFYGGAKPCQSTALIQNNIEAWVGQTEKILHLDIHTGLGPYSTFKLLLSDSADSKNYRWFVDTFGESVVESLVSGATAYPVHGHFGSWMRNRFKQRDFRFAGVEFGTYDVIRVLGAIRAENRAYHYAQPGSGIADKAGQELLECFCPSDSKWRNSVLAAALDLVEHGRIAL
ncbi:hypothetical protein AB833_07300 [Chromatiales bacterium (ex Bugula neritina AB1)]|nr:hypothetical protein AB833_07300 [Chromatiales bacterium (ex Bugula neritina AB1)]